MNPSQRVQVTKGLLKDALLKRMEQKSIDQITVSELCREAGVNRNTFYSHYASPEELLLEVEKNFSDKILTIIESTVPNDDYYHVLLRTLEAIAEEPQTVRILLGESGDPTYFSRFISVAFQRVTSIWTDHLWKTNDSDKAMLYRYTTGGAEWVVSNWVKEGMVVPPETIAGKLSRLTEEIYEKYSKVREI